MSDEAPKLAVYRAIAAIMAEMGKQGISKSRRSGSEGGPKFAYRGVDDVYAALNPLLSQHNLVVLTRVMERHATERITPKGTVMTYTVLRVEFDFVSGEDGSKHTVVTYGEAMDSGDKSTPKATSIAYKYAAFLTFAIPVEGENNDPDAQSHEVAAAKPDKYDAMSLAANRLTTARTLADIASVWQKDIDWSIITDEADQQKLVNVRREAEALIRNAAKKKEPQTYVPPSFDPQDDIPF